MRILKDYLEFLPLFKEEMSIKALLKYKLYDYEILLKKGKELPFSFIYGILINDLKTFKEYINENLKKGFIKLSSSLTKSLVLFILKKDKKKRLCVNY